MKPNFILILTILFFSNKIQGQIHSNFVNKNDKEIQNAVEFHKKYLSEFQNGSTPNYSKYWHKKDCEKYKNPDAIVYSISSDYPTYNFGNQKTIFYARKNKDKNDKTHTIIHLKTLFGDIDSLQKITIFAITNHYIKIDNLGNVLNFVRPFEIHKDLYTTTQNKNITYHYPKHIIFNPEKSDNLIVQIRKFEKEWEFNPINFEYFFTNTQDELGEMKGLDYFLGMEQSTPSGMAFPDEKIIYCSGNGEGYLHEVLHLYLNPLYENSPVNHGLIYYLGGSLGYNFDELIQKMNDYLVKYPETNLSEFENIFTKDITLNIYNVVTGLLCKIIYEKEGVNGVKRLLKYKNFTDLFKIEFKINKKDWDFFLKTNFKKYSSNKK